MTSCAQASSQPSGWPAVEEYVQEHDESMVRDYADDVDTLLVFVSHTSNFGLRCVLNLG